MEEQHLWPSERNPSAIQIKKEQIGRKAQFLLFFYHYSTSSSLSCSKSIQDVSPSTLPPPPLCLPAPGNRRLAEIFLFKQFLSVNVVFLSFTTVAARVTHTCHSGPAVLHHLSTVRSAHTHTGTAARAPKCGSYWQRHNAREQFLFIGLCQNKYNI